MRKVFILLLCLFLLPAITSCNSPNNVAVFDSGYWKESPRIYRLIGDNAMSSMPTITLYDNGNARLSQPPISSFYLSEFGHYEMDDDTLSVNYNKDTILTFSVTDHGNSLTITASNLLFTTIGCVYQYQSMSDYLDAYTMVNGPELTIEAIRELALQGQALTYSDFERYAHYDIDPDSHLFPVDGSYMLSIQISDESDTSITIENYLSGESFPLQLNGSTGYVFDEYLGLTFIPKYQPREWVDYYRDDNLRWDEIRDLKLPEYPDVTFTWTPDKVTANEVELFWGMPVWNVYLTDLTNDGKPELCATITIGSGIAYTRVIVYDYALGKTYELANRMNYDYYLTLQDGNVMIHQIKYRGAEEISSAELRLENGEIAGF